MLPAWRICGGSSCGRTTLRWRSAPASRWRPQLWEVRHIPASLLSAGLLLQRLGDLTSMNLLLLWGYILHDCMGCCRHGLFELLSVLIRKHRDRSAFMQGRWRPHGMLRWRMRCRAPSGTRGRTWSAPRLSWRGTRASSSAPWPLSRQWACLTCGGVRPPHCCRPCLDIIMPDIVRLGHFSCRQVWRVLPSHRWQA